MYTLNRRMNKAATYHYASISTRNELLPPSVGKAVYARVKKKVNAADIVVLDFEGG